jgi:hypothetical protein
MNNKGGFIGIAVVLAVFLTGVIICPRRFK